MMMLVMIFIVILIILLMMILFYLFLSKKMYKNREKMSPFECGFDNLSKMRLPFSLQFYLISIIFLIFDIEIAVILPMIKSEIFDYYMMINYMIILLILLFGLYIEWKEGAFKWMIN